LPITSLLHGNRALLFSYLKDSLVTEFEDLREQHPAIALETLNEVRIDSIPEIEAEPEYSNPEELNSFPENRMEEIAEILLEEKAPEPETFDRQEFSEMELKPVEPIVTESLIDLPFENFDMKYLHHLEKEPENKEEIISSNEITISSKEEKIEESAEIKRETGIISNIEPHDFLGWLEAKKKIKQNIPKPVDLEESKEEEIVLKEEEPVIEEKKIKKFNSLIDKFIENSPSISKPQTTKFYNPAQKAKESVIENFDLVTETLARIYMKQNNYKKAIIVYEKLSLLYPEKNSYFAAQILELQTLLNK
jgi:tetratricopeptide (TPR) repeat protein